MEFVGEVISLSLSRTEEKEEGRKEEKKSCRRVDREEGFVRSFLRDRRPTRDSRPASIHRNIAIPSRSIASYLGVGKEAVLSVVLRLMSSPAEFQVQQ